MADVPPGLTPADERAHPPGSAAAWGESWRFDLATPDGRLGVSVRLALFPKRNACWYWACLVGEDRKLVTVVDHDVAPPRPPTLEIRAEGLWADHIVETPFDHVTVGCEAFAVALDDPADVFGAAYGERVPFGLDLEWETDGQVYRCPPGSVPGGDRYEVPCRVHGEILTADERIEVDAVGHRHHAWGPEDWGSAWLALSGRLDDGTRFHAGPVAPGDGGVPAPGFVQPRSDEPLREVPPRVDAAPSTTVALGELRLEVSPVALAPEPVDPGGDVVARVHRMLCRCRDIGTGRAGVAWAERNLPHRT